MSHTPGPWVVSGLSGVLIYAPSHDEIPTTPIASVPISGSTTEAEDEVAYANARLIAAAPELLQACQVALNDRMYKDWPKVADILIAAIAKAEGTDA